MRLLPERHSQRLRSHLHLSDARFSATTAVNCTTRDFSIALYPGTYTVTLGPDTDSTTLPSWSTVVVERLLVP